ncbi:MAG: biotin/lipoyl-containing protein [Clostridia bacterium]|nr:biotin/lipoyl-containing protein [Clostridia bacterium]
MKNLKITVNGQVYDVTVEESSSTSAPVASAPAAPAAPAAAAPAPSSSDVKEVIASPMPGTIMTIEVNPGQKVKKGDNLLILEAMKMENEIVSPIDATVGQIMISKGDTVDSGTELLTLI